MRYLKKLLAACLSWLLCWTMIANPLAVYASAINNSQDLLSQEASDSTESDDIAGNLQNEDNSIESSGEPAENEENGQGSEESTSGDGASSPDGVPNTSEQLSSSDDATAHGDEINASPSSEEEQMDAATTGDIADKWSLANSWRYQNGVLRSDLGSSVSLYSMTTPPEGASLQGVDVSVHNGRIDWSKVKAAGIDFAILRLGYADVEMDDEFMNNVRGCQQNGIPFGVYVYSYAWDAASAAREGEGAVARLQQAGLDPDDLALPVYYDIENVNPNTGKPSGVNGSTYVEITGGAQTFVNMASSFIAPLQASGYEVGVYSSLSWWDSYLSSPEFSQWDRWIAQWYTSCTYEGDYTLWQYTSSGTVPGISGAVDLNWWYGAPDTSEVKITSDIEGTAVTLKASGFTIDPDNVAFAVNKNGAEKWCQAYRQDDGSWTADVNVLQEFSAFGDFSVSVWVNYSFAALKVTSETIYISPGDVEVGAAVSGESLELSASGWSAAPSNVAFEVLSPSGAGRWYQAREQGDGSWAATVDAGADFGEWGEYTVNAWASYGQDTRVYGNSPTVVIEKVSLIYSINTPHGSVMSGSDGLQASSWNGSYVENVCGITVSIQESPIEGSISYQGYVPGNGWTAVGTDGSLSGSNSSSSVFSAVKISLSGDISNYCDIWYSIYVEDFGSLGWTKNGSITGSTNLPLKVQAISIVARPKGSAAPGSTANSLLTSYPYIGYQNPLQYYQVSNKSVTVPHLGEGTFGYRTESRIPYNATREDCVNAMIQRAYDYMGTQYVWDYACAPGVGVDCAGLVLQCLYATGMDLSPMNPWDHYYLGLSGGWHSAYANYMWTNGRFQHVSLSQRQRGDIISWNGHVAIYIGNDQVIEAAPPRVRISNLWYLGTPRGVLRPFV